MGHQRRPLLENLSDEIRCGELTLLLGPNGSGKTTLTRTLLGLQRPIAGEVEPLKRSAYLPQQLQAETGFPITVNEMVGLQSARPRRTEIKEALCRTGLEGFGRRFFFALSGGEQKRVLLARALLADAEFIALDEPGAGVDDAGQAGLWPLLAQLSKEGRAVLAVTHDDRRAMQFADRCFELVDGQLTRREREES